MTKFLAHLATLPLRDQLLVRIGLDSGFRLRELLRMRISTVARADLTPLRDLCLERKELKMGRSVFARRVRARRVPMTRAVHDLLVQYLFNRFGSGPVGDAQLAETLFPSPKGGALKPRQAHNIILGVFRNAGLDASLPWGAHSLRKTWARKVYSATGHDIDLTRLALGHTSVLTTQRYLATSEAEAYEGMTLALLALHETHPEFTPTAAPSHFA